MVDLAIKDPTPIKVSDNPLIHLSCDVQSGRATLSETPQTNNPPVETEDSEQKGDLLIWDLWAKGT